MTKEEAISVIKASGLFYIPAETAALHQSAISALEDALNMAIEALNELPRMNNAEKFKKTFGLYATEMWAMSESDFLAWLNADYER